MTDSVAQSADFESAATEFFAALKSNASDEKLAEIINKHPGLTASEEFMREAFPKSCSQKDSLGRVNMDKTLSAMRKMKSLEDAGLVADGQLQAFANGTHPEIGETPATYVAKSAVAAYDKANIDRSPKDNMPEEDRQAFSAQAEKYSAMMQEMSNLGVDMNVPNKEGQRPADISSLGRIKDDNGNSPSLSGREADSNTSTALQFRVGGNEENLEVGGAEKEPLKVHLPQKEPLKVNTNAQNNPEEENEGIVEDAPEDDKGRGSSFDGKRIREQDIIDYMYNEWFLAGLDWCINKVVGYSCGSVDNLCDKFRSKAAKKGSAKAEKTEKLDKKAKNVQGRGQEILSNMPKDLRDRFSKGLADKNGYMARLNQDIAHNIGKTPQNWTAIDTQSASGKQLIKTLNEAYAKDPQGFQNRMETLEKNGKQMQNVMTRVYDIAVNMAAVQYMQENMGNKKPDLSDKKVQEAIMKKAGKNFQALMSGASAIAEHISLASKLRDGETDQTIIENNSARGVETFLKLNEAQVAKAKSQLLTDLEKGNFKANGRELSNETTEACQKMERLVADGEKQWDVLMPEKRRETAQMDLVESANRMNMNNIMQSQAAAEITNDISAITSQQANLDMRRQAVVDRRQQYERAVASNQAFNNFDRASSGQANDAIGNIIRSRSSRKDSR